MTESGNHQTSIDALEAHLASTSRRTAPGDWALASYRLGLARAESPVGVPADNLRAALDLYEGAASVLNKQDAPVEHARIMNAAGSAHRLLGNPARAVELFSAAGALLEGRGGDAERASVLSNLGLAHTDSGDPDQAVSSFDSALALLVGDDDEQRRARVATRHNQAQALMSTGSKADLASAIESLEAAAVDCSDTDAPLHQAMVWHSLGVARKGQAETEPKDRDAVLEAAIDDFERCLTIFTVSAFPFHHAIAKQNLGLALEARGDLESSRTALSYYEDAVTMFDPRLHASHWRATYANLEALEAKLAEEFPSQTRHDHFAALLGGMDEIQRLAALRERLTLLERLPHKQLVERLGEIAYAVVTQPPPSFVATLRTMIMVLMELPEGLLHAALEGQYVAHQRLDPHDRRAADFVLDEVIDALLFGPQRIRVRDLLAEIGWERP